MACISSVGQCTPDGGSDSMLRTKGPSIAKDVRNLGKFAGELQANLDKEHREQLAKAIVCKVRKNDRNALQIIADYMAENSIASVVEGALSYWISKAPASQCFALDLYDILCGIDDDMAQQCEGLLQMLRARCVLLSASENTHVFCEFCAAAGSPGNTRPDPAVQLKKNIVFTGMAQVDLDVYFEQLAAVLESDDVRRLSNILLKEHFFIGATAVDNFARDNSVSAFQAMMTLWLKKQTPQADGAGYVAALAFNQRAAVLSKQILDKLEPSH